MSLHTILPVVLCVSPQRVPFVPVNGFTREAFARVQLSEVLARIPRRDTPERRAGDADWSQRAALDELTRRAESGTMTRDDWIRALEWADVFHTRRTWPAGEPLFVWIRDPEWLRYARITMRVIEPELGEIEADNRYPSGCANCMVADLWSQRFLELGPLPIGTNRLDVEVSVAQRDEPDVWMGGTGIDCQLWRGRIEFSVRAVPDLDAAMPATPDERSTRALRSRLRADWTRYPEDDSVKRLYLRVAGAYEDAPELHGLAVSADVELRCRGVVRARGWLGIRGRWPSELHSDRFSAYCEFEETPFELASPGVDPAGWEVAVAGTSDGVLCQWDADRWWSGTLELPLSEILPSRDPK